MGLTVVVKPFVRRKNHCIDGGQLMHSIDDRQQRLAQSIDGGLWRHVECTDNRQWWWLQAAGFNSKFQQWQFQLMAARGVRQG